MAKIVITGITGFVGGALAKRLVAEEIDVVGMVRPSSQNHHLIHLPITWVEGDVTDPDSLRHVFDGADGVIHAAGMLGQTGVPEAVYHRLHVAGTRHVLAEAARLSPPPRLLYVSSPGVLGPISGPPADEAAPLAPSNPYERSKAVAEQVALQFAADGLPLIIIRPEFIYGPGDTHVLGLFQTVQRGRFFYIGNGRNECHPTYIDDAVEGMWRCWQHGRSGEIYHVTGPRPVTFRELGQAIAQALDVQPPWLAVPKPVAWLGAAVLEKIGLWTGRTPPLSRTGVSFFSEDRRFSWQKAHEELGYTPQVDLSTGVRRTIAWYREKGIMT